MQAGGKIGKKFLMVNISGYYGTMEYITWVLILASSYIVIIMYWQGQLPLPLQMHNHPLLHFYYTAGCRDSVKLFDKTQVCW